jgi:hypothetical protein
MHKLGTDTCAMLEHVYWHFILQVGYQVLKYVAIIFIQYVVQNDQGKNKLVTLR